MACLYQWLLGFVQFVGGPLFAIGVVTRLLGWLNLFPVFQCKACEVHRYTWFGRWRRTVSAKIQLRLGFWPTEVQASLRLIRNGVLLDTKYWLAWEEQTNPEKTKLPPFHTSWVRILSVDEHDKTTGVPLSAGNGLIGFSPVPDGEYEVQLWLRCPFWGLNEGQRFLTTWHWRVPDDIMNREYKN